MAFHRESFRKKVQRLLSLELISNLFSTVFFFGVLLFSSPVLAHPGALNQFGCHFHELSEDYECHQGKLAGKIYTHKSDMVKDYKSGKTLIPSFVAKVVAVSDGDTLKVMRSGEVLKVHLAGIDCPEKKQPFGQEAKRFTLDLTVGRKVILRNRGIGSEGLPSFEVILPDGRSLNKELVQAGLAWWFIGNSKNKLLSNMEKKARVKKVGLWKSKAPLPPWEFRKGRYIQP